jgi:hypothetical protein
VSGRQVYDSVDDALLTYPWWPEENLVFIREKIANLDVTEVYTPPERSYIALRLKGVATIVTLNFGFIAGLRNEDGKEYWIELPVNRIHDGGYTRNAEAQDDPCPNCGILLPASGLCGNCY